MGDASSFSSLSSSSSSDMGEWEESSSLGVGQRPSAYSSPSCVVSNPRWRKGNSGLGLAELLRDDDEPRHFLDACFLCNKSIGRNRDVFMYRGDTPFCSEECRQEQIEKDEAAERMQKRSLKVKAASSKKKNAQKKAGSSTPNDLQFLAGTTVAG